MAEYIIGTSDPLPFDFFQQITAINFPEGGGYLLLHVDIAGGASSKLPAPPPPSIPFGSFSDTPPSGTLQLEQQTLIHTQTSIVTPDTSFYPWNTLVAPPTVANYKTTAAWSVNANLVWASVDIVRGFPNDPAFPAPNSDALGYTTSARAAAAAALLPSISDNNYFASLADYLSDRFTNNGSTGGIPNSLSWGVVSVSSPTTSVNTEINMEFLFKIPAKLAGLPFTFTVPTSSAGSGIASIFTNQKKVVKSIADLTGVADMTATFPVAPVGTTTFSVQTTAKKSAGTVSINGVPGSSPGLPPTAGA